MWQEQCCVYRVSPPLQPKKTILLLYFSPIFITSVRHPKIYVFPRVVDFNVLRWARVISYHKMITLRDLPFLQPLMLPRLTSLAVRAKPVVAVLGSVIVNGNAPVGITELGQCRHHRARAEILASQASQEQGSIYHGHNKTKVVSVPLSLRWILSLFAVRSQLIFEGTE